MNFKKQKIEAKIIGIIDVGTYKARVAITKFKNRDLELIGYGEKRQDFINNCQNNFDQVISTIKQSIKKAENNGDVKISDIIINIPFGELFFETSKINYIRKNNSKLINKEELNEIILEIKENILKKAFKNIKNNYSYNKNQLKLIICNISNILIDKIETKNLLGKNPKEINITMLNIFIPETKYDYIKKIGKSLNKKIINIVPSEYSVAKLDYNKKNVVIIDLGSCYTSIIVKEKNNIVGARKFAVGIQELITEISKKYSITRAIVIDTIDNDLYLKEKDKFLDIIKNIIIISLEEILGNTICPNNFFMIGGGSNQFIKKYIQEIDFNEYGLKMTKKISFITPNIEYLDDIDSSKSNLNIFSMMNCSINLIKRQKDPIEDSLKKIMNY